MKSNPPNSNKHGIVLACFALVVTLALTTTQWVTKDRINSNEKRHLQTILTEVLPPDSYDHALQDTLLEVFDPIANRNRTCYTARLNGIPTAVVISAVATDGYSGNIDLLVGIMADGTISGVRVTKHRETPGLGDAIELQRSSWITDFDGKSLTTPPESRWKVKKQQGDFDQFTGATITPRAVVKEVKNTLLFFESAKTQLLTHE